MKLTPFLCGLAGVLFYSCSEHKTIELTKATHSPDSLSGKNTYINPVDGKTYSSDSEFKEYKPEGESKPISGPVQPINVVLLTDQNTT